MKTAAAARLIKRLRRPGIVYCATTVAVDQIWRALTRARVPCARYHGKMAADERRASQKYFMKGGDKRIVMVATSAFGMGIDKANVRYVVHYHAPASLEQYVQEAGRAGRDGRRAHAILLHSDDDRAVHEALLARSRVRPDQLAKLGRALVAWAGEGRRPTLEALALSAELGPRIASALLALVEETGLVRWDGAELAIAAPQATLEQDVRAVLTKVELGEVDAALVYRTDVLAAGEAVEGLDFPEAAEAVNDYPIVVLTEAPNPEAAQAFVDLVLSDEGQQVLRDAGFGAP